MPEALFAQSKQSTSSKPSKCTILVLAANPHHDLRLDHEVKKIDDSLLKAKYRDQFQLEQSWATSIDDLRSALMRYNPQIVHFCGHGKGDDGLVLENNSKPELISSDALSSMFALLKDQVECVVLNVCYSEIQAQAIAEHIPYVIGMKKAIGDKAAIEFSKLFYQALGSGRGFNFAFKWGADALNSHHIPEHLTPIIKSSQTRSIDSDSDYQAHPKKDSTKHPTEHIAAPKEKLDGYDEWLSFELDYNESTQKLSITDDNNQQISILLNALPTTNSSDAQWQQISHALLNGISSQTGQSEQQKIRLRIMTNHEKLAQLSWYCLPHPDAQKPVLDLGWGIEVSPTQRRYDAGFNKITCSQPLLIIPSNYEHGIAADKHYAQAQSFLAGNLDIYGPIPRISTPKSIKRELELHEPDLIYIYACFEDNHIILDADNDGQNTITLQQLGEWLESLKQTIKPLIIINLIAKHTINEYPTTLINNSRLLWILSTQRNSRIADLEKQLFNVIEQLPQNGDISQLINQQSRHQPLGMQSLLWLNGKTPYLTLDPTEQRRQQQFRAALLKVMLGREELKDRLYGGISKHISKETRQVVYAVTGTSQACPFDVPAQIQQRLQWDNDRNLPVIPFYFHIQLPQLQTDNAENGINDLLTLFDDVIKNSILHGSPHIEEIFQQKLDDQGLQHQECCIMLNWYFKIPEQQQDRLRIWLEVWSDIICEYFADTTPEKSILVHALCLESPADDSTHTIHKSAYQVLREKAQQHCSKQNIIIKHPLGILEAEEISDFFADNNNWYTGLNLQEFKVDANALAEWVCDKTQGEFEDTVTLLWNQYKSDYKEFNP